MIPQTLTEFLPVFEKQMWVPRARDEGPAAHINTTFTEFSAGIFEGHYGAGVWGR